MQDFWTKSSGLRCSMVYRKITLKIRLGVVISRAFLGGFPAVFLLR